MLQIRAIGFSVILVKVPTHLSSCAPLGKFLSLNCGLFICKAFHKYLLSAYSMPDTILVSEDMEVYKKKSSCPLATYSLLEEKT